MEVAKKRIGIVGHRGMLGSALIALGCEPWDNTHNFDVIINCAAKTNHDFCEAQPKHALFSNAIMVAEVLKFAHTFNVPVIHISSDYVFDGQKSEEYHEDDLICPLPTAYAQSKAAGELVFNLMASSNDILLRTSWLFGAPRKAFFTYPEIWSQVGSPTYADDLACALMMIAEKMETEDKPPKVLHYSTDNCILRSQMAMMAGTKGFEVVERPINRPRNSSLRTSTWILQRHTRPSLQSCINDYLRKFNEPVTKEASV